jgi:predicted  nucleic acid-binding Zn-ribbon protein
MNETNVQQALQRRVDALALRIAAAEAAMRAETTPNRIRNLGALHELQKRQDYLQRQLLQLEDDGHGWRPDVKATLSLLADNIQGGLDDLMFSTDARYQASEKTY